MTKTTKPAILAFLATAAIMLLPAGAAAQSQVYSTPPSPQTQVYSTPPNVVPEGVRLLVKLDDTLDTARMNRGKQFKAELAEDLIGSDGQVLIPRGKRVKGHVSDIERGLHGRLLLSFNEIETRHGTIPLIATVTGVPGEHGVKPETGPEGEIERRSVDKQRTIESTVVGAAIGAVAGATIAGGRGAAIGAAVGGAGGGGAGILLERDLKLQKGQMLELRLDRQLVVPAR